MTDTQPIRPLSTIGGGAIAGLLSFVAFALIGANPVPSLIGGLILLTVIGITAWAAYRSGRRSLAFGVLGGYGLLTLLSGGQCTLLLEPGDAVAIGFFGYPLIMIVAFVVAAVVTDVRRRRQREGDQP